MTRVAELKLTLLDPRPCKELLVHLEQSLKRMRFRIQEREDDASDGTTNLKAVEGAHWWNSEVGSRLPIWIELKLEPAARSTKVQLKASLTLVNILTPGSAQAVVRSRVVRLCRLTQLPQEQMQELLALQARSERRRLGFLALLVALVLTGFTLSQREGSNGPNQPSTTTELESVVP